MRIAVDHPVLWRRYCDRVLVNGVDVGRIVSADDKRGYVRTIRPRNDGRGVYYGDVYGQVEIIMLPLRVRLRWALEDVRNWFRWLLYSLRLRK